MATVKFPSEMAPATSIGGNDKLMISKEATGEAYQATFNQAKEYLNITGIELEPLVGGDTSGTALVVAPGPSGEQRTAEVASGKYYDFGSGPQLADADKRWKSYWTGTSWVLKDMGELPMQPVTGVVKKGNTNATSGGEVWIGDRKVTRELTESFNLVNPVEVISDFIIRSDTGELIYELGSATTMPILLNGIEFVSLSGQNSGVSPLGFRFLDSNGAKMMATETNGGIPSTYALGNNGWAKAPSGAEYVQFSYRKSGVGDTSSLMLNKGKIAFRFTPFKQVPKGQTDLAEKTRTKADSSDIFIAGGVNLVNPNMRIIDGYRISSTTGLDYAEEGSAMTELIPIKPNTAYRLDGRDNDNPQFRFLTADLQPRKTTAGGVEVDFTFPNTATRRSPVDAAYAQIIFKNNGKGTLDTLMFYEGSSAKPFEKFVPVINPLKLPGVTFQGGFIGTAKDLDNKIEENINSIIGIQNLINASQTDIGNIQVQMLSKISATEKASPNGVATLNQFGKIPASQIDISGLKLIGNYNPVTNTPALSDGTGVANNYYIITQDGSRDFGSGAIVFKKGDKVVYSADGKWVLDANKDVPNPVADTGLSTNSQFIRVNDALYNIYNEFDRSYRPYVKVNNFKNGIAITDANIDGVLYRKIGNEYFGEAKFVSYGIVDSIFYGIKSDGITNDQPLMQILVDFLHLVGGGVINLASGRTRLLNRGIKWRSNVSLIGNGMMSSVLQADATKTDDFFLNAIYQDDMPSDGQTWSPLVNCQWKNFMIDCSGYHNVGKSSVGRKGMFILGMDKCCIENVFVYRSIGTGIGCDFLTRTSIKNCLAVECGSYIGDGTVPEIGQSGIGIGSGSQLEESVVVDGNWCIGNGNYGIFVENQTPREWAKSNAAKIINNHCYGNRHGIGNKGSGRTLISGNTCYNNLRHGILVDSYSSGNMIIGNELAYNIKSGLFCGTTDVVGESELFSNNKCHHNSEYGIYIASVSNGRNVIAKSNTCNNNGLSGIFVGYYLSNIEVSDNTCFDNGVSGNSANAYGIFIRSGSHNVVKGNHVYNKFGTQTKGIVISKGLTSSTFLQVKPTIVMSNVLTGYATANGVAFDASPIVDVDYVLNNNVILS